MTTSLPLSAPRHLPVLDEERFADAFAPQATVGRPDLGADLWAVLHEGPSARLLYVHNPTDRTQSFRPAAVFGDDSVPLFLSGAISTAGEEGAGLIVQLLPQADVWLAWTDTPR